MHRDGREQTLHHDGGPPRTARLSGVSLDPSLNHFRHFCRKFYEHERVGAV